MRPRRNGKGWTTEQAWGDFWGHDATHATSLAEDTPMTMDDCRKTTRENGQRRRPPGFGPSGQRKQALATLHVTVRPMEDSHLPDVPLNW